MTSKPYYMVSGAWTVRPCCVSLTVEERRQCEGDCGNLLATFDKFTKQPVSVLTHWGKNESINRRSAEEWSCQPGPLHAWKHSVEHAKPMMRKTLTDHPVDSHGGFVFFFFLADSGLPVWGLTEFPSFKGKAAETVLRARANPSHLWLN